MLNKYDFLPIVKPIGRSDAENERYVTQLDELVRAIDPELIGSDYAAALAQGDAESCIKLLAAHYRNRPDNSVPELSSVGEYDAQKAYNASRRIMREVNVDWTFEGDIDYAFDPTHLYGPVNPEWIWQFNRHRYWLEMARAYRASGDEYYAKEFRYQLLTWIATTEPPKAHNGIGSAWRTIECGIRLLGPWQVAFDGFRKSPSVEDVTVVLMIASMLKQTRHLVANPTKNNWLMMEMNGVYSFSALFPEVREAQKNRAIATEHLLREMTAQILPDGMHCELSPDYQSVVLVCATNFIKLAYALGYQAEVPSSFVELVRSTVNAALSLSTPAFTQPRTNDTYTILTSTFINTSAPILGQTPEGLFVTTERKEGSAPLGETASRFLDYAGFAVMRNDWSADSSYACFDVGPLGTAHMHQDKLNVNIFKGSVELLYDDGGGQYDFSEVRKYALSGYSHNTALVDGLAQNRNDPKSVDSPIDAGWRTNAKRDYAVGVYSDGFGDSYLQLAEHKRELRFEKPDLFIIRDTLTSRDGKPHDYELLFHLDTLNVTKPKEYENAVLADYGKDYRALIIPLDEKSDSVKLALESAQKEPYYSGWYNGRNESCLHPSTTVRRGVKSVDSFTFTTLVLPLGKDEPIPQLVRSGDKLTVTFGNNTYSVDLSHLAD